MCIHTACKTRPVFNFEGETNAIYCSKHKKDGMINIKNKTCLECKKQPVFNFEGETNAIYCSKHKKDGMINVKDKTCLECKTRPAFNFEGEKNAIYCSKHKKDGMINVKDKTCINSHCLILVANYKYDGYCLVCYINDPKNRDKPIIRNYKTKERLVADFIKTTFLQYNWIFDKIIQNGCSNKRPDILLDMEEYVILIEIDENRHNLYDCSCENKRVMEISQDLGHRPIVLIRFNPDKYTNQDNILIKSCFHKDAFGLMLLNNSMEKEWNHRLEILKQQVEYWTNNQPDRTITPIELFY
jgi:hypothetical protein